MVDRNRPKISITLDPDMLAEVDRIAERFGENRSRVLERLVADGVWQHRHIGKGPGTLPDIIEVYRRVFVYKDRYEMGGMGLRAKAYDLRWDDLPKELQEFFPPNVEFPVWKGTTEMLNDERAALEHNLEMVKHRLAKMEGRSQERKGQAKR